MLTEPQKAAYLRDGYLVLPRLIPLPLVDEFTVHLKSVADAWAKRHGLPTGYLDSTITELDRIDHAEVAAIYDTIQNTDIISAIVGSAHLRTKVRDLMGLPLKSACYFMYHNVRIDPPQDERFTYGWHQQSYFSAFEAGEVQLWTPLVRPSTREMGSISVLRGSHADGEIRRTIRQLTEDSHVEMHIPDEDITREYEEVFIEIEPGDALLFHPHLIHRSNTNVSNRIRYSLVATYVDVTDDRFRWASKQAMRQHHLERCTNYAGFFGSREADRTLSHV